MRPSLSALVVLFLFSLSGIAAVWYGLINQHWFEASIALVFFILFFAIASTLIRERLYVAAALTLTLVATLFALGLPSWPWLVSISAFILMWWGYTSAASEKKILPSATPRRLLSVGFSVFMTGVALLSALFYFVHHESPQTTALVPRSVFDFALPYIEKFSQNITHLPGPIDPNAQIDDLLRQFVISQFKTQSHTPTSSEIEENVRLERESLNSQYRMNLRGDEKVSDVLYRLINEKGESILGPYANILSYILAGGVFFGIKAVSFLFYGLSLGFVYLLIAIAKPLGLIRVEEETITVQHYSL